MSLYKLLGAVLLVLSAWGASGALCERPRARLAQTDGFLQLFRTLRHGIFYDRASVKETLAALSPEVATVCSGTGERAAGEDLSALAASCSFLSEELALLVKRAAAELAGGYREEQIAVCDRAIEALEDMHQKQAAYLREKTVLGGRLLPVLAAGAVILLL